MEKQILADVPKGERIEMLRSSADAVEKFTYQRELDIGEVQELQVDLSQNLIVIDKEDQKLKIAKEQYKAVVKPMREKIKSNLQMIRTQMEEVNDEVFLMKDLEENKMGYYSKEGKLVYERALKADEMQFTIQEHLRKAE